MIIRRFGKPEITVEPEPETVEVEYCTLSVVLATGVTWKWTFEGEDTWERAKALHEKLTGEPDDLGWIRDISDEWACRADEIRSVVIQRQKKHVSKKADPRDD